MGLTLGDVIVQAKLEFANLKADVETAMASEGDPAMAAAGEKTGKSFVGRFGDAVKKNATKIGVTLGAGLGTGLALAGQAAASFQDQLLTINTVAKLPEATLKGLGDQIQQLARDSGKSTADLTAGFYDLVSAGVPADKAMKVLRDSTVLATGALGTTAEVVDLVTSAMNAYGLEASSSTRITDIFATAVADGKVTAAELGGTIAQIAPIAAAAGVSLEEVAAGFALMTAKGTPAAQAATQMRSAISALLTPNAQLAELSAKVGINFAEMAKEKGLAVTLDEIRKATGGNNEEFAKALGSVEAYQYALQVTGDNAGAAATELGKVTAGADKGGVALEQAGIKMGSSVEQGKRLSETLKTLAQDVGEFLGPVQPLLMAFGPLVGQAIGALGGALGGLFVKVIIPALFRGLPAMLVAAVTIGEATGVAEGEAQAAAVAGPGIITRLVGAILGLALPLGIAGGTVGTAVGTAIALAIPIAIVAAAAGFVLAIGWTLGMFNPPSDAQLAQQLEEVKSYIQGGLDPTSATLKVDLQLGNQSEVEYAAVVAAAKVAVSSMGAYEKAVRDHPPLVGFQAAITAAIAKDQAALVAPATQLGTSVAAATSQGLREGGNLIGDWLSAAATAGMLQAGQAAAHIGDWLSAAATAGMLQAGADAALAAANLPKTIGDAILAAAGALKSDLSTLQQILKDGMTPKKAVAEALGFDTVLAIRAGIKRGDPIAVGEARTVAIDALAALSAAALTEQKGKGKGAARTGQLMAELYASGMDDRQVYAALHAAGLTDAAIAKLMAHAPGAKKPGAATGDAFGDGIDTPANVTNANTGGANLGGAALTGLKSPDYAGGGYWSGTTWISALSGAITHNAAFGEALNWVSQRMHGASPPPKGPLHTLDKGGWNAGDAWVSALVARLVAGARDVTQALGGYAMPALAMGDVMGSLGPLQQSLAVSVGQGVVHHEHVHHLDPADAQRLRSAGFSDREIGRGLLDGETLLRNRRQANLLPVKR